MSTIGSVPLSPPMPHWARARQPATLVDTDAMQVSRQWLDSKAWGLLMLGGVGRGKSLAAAWLWIRLGEEDIVAASALFAQARGVLWLRARVLQRLSWQERAEVLRGCAAAYGLVVDEMGAEDGRTAQAIGDLLEERGDRGARTVMTTNLGAQGFLDRYGDRLTSRLRSGGIDKGHARWAKVVHGEDLRGVEMPDEPAPEVRTPITPERQDEILKEFDPGTIRLVKEAISE